VFQDTLYYFPSSYAKPFQGLFRRKTTRIRIRKRRKRVDTKTTKKERSKAMKEYEKKPKKIIKIWRIRRPKET
jgi:hypothetical protein